MKTAIISYSLTGNNEAIATRIAKEMKVEHIRVTERKKRTNGTIAIDLLLGRIPFTQPGEQVLSSYDLIIFVAPIWMGQPAFPLRSYLGFLKKHPIKYAYVSISGGAMNDNPGLEEKLLKRTGMEPCVLVDHNIIDLLPTEPKPTTHDTSKYRLTEEDIERLAEHTVDLLKEKLSKEVVCQSQK